MFAVNLRRLRNGRKISQAEAAHGAGVNVRTYQKYESGEVFPGPEKIRKLAKTLNISQADLFTSTDQEEGALSRDEISGRIVTLLPALNDDELLTVLRDIEATPSILRSRTVVPKTGR